MMEDAKTFDGNFSDCLLDGLKDPQSISTSEEILSIKKGLGRNKDEEVTKSVYSFRSHSSSSSSQCNWRIKEGLDMVEIPLSAKNQRMISKRAEWPVEALQKRGYLCFKCDSESSIPQDLSEADRIWSILKVLHRENKEIFKFLPSKHRSNKGYTFVRCYTSDYKDVGFISKVASIIREQIDFPYIIEYYRVKNLYNCIYIYTHAGELYKKVKKNWKLCN